MDVRRLAVVALMGGTMFSGFLAPPASAAPASTSTAATSSVLIAGNWDVSYQFQDAPPGTDTLTFVTGGTFTDTNNGETGTYTLNGKTLSFTFAACGKTTYKGTYHRAQLEFRGIMATSRSCGTVSTGTWTMIRG